MELGVNNDDLSTVTKVGIDDTSSKKGHNYVTGSVDLEKRRVINLSEGRRANAIAELAEALEAKKGMPRRLVRWQ